MRFDFTFKASRQSFRVVYVKRSSPKRSRNASAAVRDGSRSEQRIASHHVGRDRRGLGCQVHDKNASTPCISPHGERLRYPLSSGTPLRSRFSAGSRSDFQKSWAETSLESFMPGMQSHANQGVGCMSDFCSSCANSLWYPDSAESLENPRDISKRYFGPSFLSSSPLSPAMQSSLRSR